MKHRQPTLSIDKFQQKLLMHVPFTAYFPASWRCKLNLTDPPNHNPVDMLEPPTQTIATNSAYAAILDHFFQPPTSETKILRYGFTKESLKNVYMMPFLTTRARS